VPGTCGEDIPFDLAIHAFRPFANSFRVSPSAERQLDWSGQVLRWTSIIDSPKTPHSRRAPHPARVPTPRRKKAESRGSIPWIRQYVTNRNHVALAKTSGICPPQKLGGSAFGFGFFLLANVEENGTERPKFWNACWRHAGQAGVASYPTYGEERPGGGIWPPAARLMVRFEGHISRLARRERRCFRTDVQ
jgi:hypothetical protein